MIYFEMCKKIWGSSLATEQIDGAVESLDLTEASEVQSESTIGSPASQREDESSGASAQPLADDSSVSGRR